MVDLTDWIMLNFKRGTHATLGEFAVTWSASSRVHVNVIEYLNIEPRVRGACYRTRYGLCRLPRSEMENVDVIQCKVLQHIFEEFKILTKRSTAHFRNGKEIPH